MVGSSEARHPVVLFDGDCNLCDRSVQFVLARDRRALFRFAALQSRAGRELLAAHAPDLAGHLDSIALVVDDRVYRRSAAALRIAGRLPWPWPLAWVFWIVPGPLRDLLYRFVARNRHRWFGRPARCLVPTAEHRGRFLDLAERDGGGFTAESP